MQTKCAVVKSSWEGGYISGHDEIKILDKTMKESNQMLNRFNERQKFGSLEEVHQTYADWQGGFVFDEL